MALDSDFPYTLREYVKDISRWCAATKVSTERQGPLLALAIGGAGRVAVDEISEDLLKSGAVVDLGDGQGAIHHSGISAALRTSSEISRQPRGPDATGRSGIFRVPTEGG